MAPSGTGEQEGGEREELAASSLAPTSVLRQRGEKVPAFVGLFASAEGGGEAGLGALCATQQVCGEAPLPG